MSWFFYSLGSAFSLATADALSKKALENESLYVIAWVRFAYCTPFLFILLYMDGIPEIDITFWYTILALLPFEIIATILYIQAIKISPLSLTIPFLSLTPVFLILTSWIILGEIPDRYGLIGILLVSFGGYVLNIHTTQKGLLEPIRAILSEKGSVYMIIVAFIYSITSSLGKVAIQHSSPAFFGAAYFFILTVVFTPLVISEKKASYITQLFTLSWKYWIIGFFFSLMVISHCIAIRLIDVAYMISIKRLSLIFSVIYGKIMFKEENIKERLAGSIIMVIGVIFILIR
jgi:drug/metabolite transporter (DMT)-like permease